MVAAGAPDYNLETLRRVIRGKIVAGYRGEGFFDVEVAVTAADDGLVVTIKEGERFANGRIEVAGNCHVDVAALRKSISLGLLRPFDRLLVDAGHAPQEHFCIPRPLFHVRASSLAEFQSLARELAPLYGLQVVRFLFPADSWMNAAWRQGLFAVAKKRIVWPDELWTMHGYKTGPLRALATAELLRAAGAVESALYAVNGMGRQSIAAFHDDCRDLISGTGFLSELLLTTVGAIKQLKAEEIEALLALFVEYDLLSEPQAVAITDI